VIGLGLSQSRVDGDSEQALEVLAGGLDAAKLAGCCVELLAESAHPRYSLAFAFNENLNGGLKRVRLSVRCASVVGHVLTITRRQAFAFKCGSSRSSEAARSGRSGTLGVVPDDKARVSLEGLDPETALRALLKVDPDSEPVEQDQSAEPKRTQTSDDNDEK
jgi:hypothetical protein